MKDTAGAKTIDLKWFGTLSQLQILGVVAAFLIALVLTLLGFGNSCYCFGMLVIGIVLYMVPRLLGVENLKLMALIGVLFAVCAILIGGLAIAPGFVERNQGTPSDNDYFTDIQYTYTSGGMDINVTLTEKYSEDYTIHFIYGNVQGIVFQGMNTLFDKNEYLDVDATGTHASAHISSDDLNPKNLYAGYLTYMQKNDSGDDVKIDESSTNWTFLTGAHDGDNFTSLSLYGCLISTIYILIIFFMIMILSNIMRGRMEKTREKMEKDGRLYPQGYGRCGQCGAMVLPGELNCRKCGAYIDRPEDMKPKKKDFFECSDCGAEVPVDAKRCPKCGAEFDEEEFEVMHSDGTVETTGETFGCPECGAAVPMTASFCPKCGAKFGDDKK